MDENTKTVLKTVFVDMTGISYNAKGVTDFIISNAFYIL